MTVLHRISIAVVLVLLVGCRNSAPPEPEPQSDASNGSVAVIASTATPPPTDTPAPPTEASPTEAPPTEAPPTEVPPTVAPTVAPVAVDLPSAPEWVTIPSGNATLGSSAEEVQAARTECLTTGADCPERLFTQGTPQETSFVEEFKMTKYEITNAQYGACVATGACQAARSDSELNGVAYRPEFSAPANPVVGVTAADASTYCQSIGGRLPHRAEWTRSAQGDDGRTYPWGNQFEVGNTNVASPGPASAGTFDIGGSPLRVMDMVGNVWEWTDQDVRASGNSGPELVVRGGSWFSPQYSARITYLGEVLPPSTARYDVGIRCVLETSGNGASLVQQAEPISIQFTHTDGQLQWLVRHAASATVTCMSPLGRSVTGEWQVQIDREESASVPENTITCGLTAVGYDDSTVSESVQMDAQPCTTAPNQIFGDTYSTQASSLGCPTGDSVTIPELVEQPFQGGYMVWREDTDAVYVIYTATGRWQSDPTWKWDGSNPDGVGLTPPDGLLEPIRGFGWVWRTHLGGQASALGWALKDEQKFNNIGQAQSFEGGLLLAGSDGKIFVLLDSARQ